jgi:hypothetical protein
MSLTEDPINSKGGFLNRSFCRNFIKEQTLSCLEQGREQVKSREYGIYGVDSAKYISHWYLISYFTKYILQFKMTMQT